MWARRHGLKGVLLEFLQLIYVLIDTLGTRVLLVFNLTLNRDISLLQVDQLLLLYNSG